ncbi:hypothetical protein [Catenuloplanes atrovinosus]|uniref:Uncharacterized protein n=1 Tax=Catenuloplanes atrovinosus TaxID=137266 RepID=A0AAE4CBR2_9ACTN|nr:hypothetical protein [Catenuloplanes atrovinosus]MDR7278906.1 hypothetical protein [Catenuloplanes atrovinosus]
MLIAISMVSFGALAAIGGGALVLVIQARLALRAAAAEDAQRTGRHRVPDPDPAPELEPVPAEQAWADLGRDLPAEERARDALRTPTDERVRIGGPVLSTADTTTLPRVGAQAQPVVGEPVLEYREGPA